MLGLVSLARRLGSWLHRRDVTVWYDPRYRLPISGIEAVTGLEPRRADFAAWWLRESGAIPAHALRRPHRISWENLARVHSPALLESLGRPEIVASIFAVDPSDVPVDEVMTTVRLACGGTLAGARDSLRTRTPALNLLGGFHHAGPAVAGGNCPVNDVAVAIATLRAEGFDGRIAVLDLDAHPPDGLSACLARDQGVWLGSISGSDWGPLERADETVLPEGTGDAAYLEALGALLERMPRPKLAFLLAGGDVLAGDRFGKLGLTLEGARDRDLVLAAELEWVPQVWLPAGGYSDDAWRALAGTGLAVTSGSRQAIPAGYDPVAARFARLARELSPASLTEVGELTVEDVEEELGMRPRRPRLLLGFYTESGSSRPSTATGSSTTWSGSGTGSSARRSTRRARASGCGSSGSPAEWSTCSSRWCSSGGASPGWRRSTSTGCRCGTRARSSASGGRASRARRSPGSGSPARSGPCSRSWRRGSGSGRWCSGPPTTTPPTRPGTPSSS